MGMVSSPNKETRLWGGGRGRGGDVVRRSVGSAALEGVEQHVPHRADVGLDPVEAVAIDLANFAALLVGAVSFGDEFAIKAMVPPIRAVSAAVIPWSRKARATASARVVWSFMVVLSLPQAAAGQKSVSR